MNNIQFELQQEAPSWDPPVVTGICDPNKSWARHHCSLKLESKIEHISRDKFAFIKFFPVICAPIKSDGGALPKS